MARSQYHEQKEFKVAVGGCNVVVGVIEGRPRLKKAELWLWYRGL